MVSKRDLNSAELETMRTPRSPTTVMTANGEVQTREEATLHVKEFDLFVKVMLLEETFAVLSLGKLCEDGFFYHWTSAQKHISRIMARKSIAIHQATCHSSSLVCRRVPPLHLHLLLQHHHRRRLIGTENPAAERSGSTSEELRRNPLHRSVETENTKNGDDEEVQSDGNSKRI